MKPKLKKNTIKGVEKPFIITMDYGKEANKMIGWAYVKYGWQKDFTTLFVYKKKPKGNHWQKILITPITKVAKNKVGK